MMRSPRRSGKQILRWMDRCQDAHLQAQPQPSPQLPGRDLTLPQGPDKNGVGRPRVRGLRKGLVCGPLPGWASSPQTERSALTSGHRRAAGTRTRTAPTCRRSRRAGQRPGPDSASRPRVPGRALRPSACLPGGKVEKAPRPRAPSHQPHSLPCTGPPDVQAPRSSEEIDGLHASCSA